MKSRKNFSFLNFFFVRNNELVSQSATAFFIRIFSALVSLIMNIVVARYLGAQEAGYFFLTLSIITVAATFCRMGADNIMLRFISIHMALNEWNNMQSIIWILIKRAFILSLFLTPFIVFSSAYIANDIFKKPEIATPLMWMGLSIPFFTSYMLLSYAFQGIKKISYSVTIQGTILPLLMIISILIFSLHSSNETSFIYFISSLATLLFAFISWKKITKGNVSEYKDKKQLIKESSSLWIVAILQQCVQWGGQLICGLYVKPEEVAQFAVAQRTSLFISFILIAVNLVSAPRFAALYNKNEIQELKRYVAMTTRFLVLISLPLAIIILIFSKNIMALFGKDFIEASLLLRILALGQFINMITGSVGYLLLMSGHQKDMRNISIINGILTVILLITLIPMFGVTGAAIATTVSVSSQNIMETWFAKKRLNINTLAVWKFS